MAASISRRLETGNRTPYYGNSTPYYEASGLLPGLLGQHPVGRGEVDQRIGIEVRGDDVGPVVQDPVQLLVACDIQDRDRAAPDAGIDLPAHARLLVALDPGPERLPLRCDLRGALRP